MTSIPGDADARAIAAVIAVSVPIAVVERRWPPPEPTWGTWLRPSQLGNPRDQQSSGGARLRQLSVVTRDVGRVSS